MQRDRRVPACLARDGSVTLGDGRDLPPVPELTAKIIKGGAVVGCALVTMSPASLPEGRFAPFMIAPA